MSIQNTDLESNSEGVKIHPNAFVDSKAELHAGVTISIGVVVGPDVIIGKGTVIGPNAVIEGKTKIGRNNKISQMFLLDPIPKIQISWSSNRGNYWR